VPLALVRLKRELQLQLGALLRALQHPLALLHLAAVNRDDPQEVVLAHLSPSSPPPRSPPRASVRTLAPGAPRRGSAAPPRRRAAAAARDPALPSSAPAPWVAPGQGAHLILVPHLEAQRTPTREVHQLELLLPDRVQRVPAHG